MTKGFYRYRRKLKPISVDGGIKFVDPKKELPSFFVSGVPANTMAYWEHNKRYGRFNMIVTTNTPPPVSYEAVTMRQRRLLRS